MIKTTIVVENSFNGLINRNKLSKVSKYAFQHLNIFNAEISLSIVGDDAIINLNKKYRYINSITDVLSFPSLVINPETGIRYYGDIVISYPAALRQFSEYHNSVIDEMIFLTIHGILHLLDFDHEKLLEKNIMFNLQNTIFRIVKAEIDS